MAPHDPRLLHDLRDLLTRLPRWHEQTCRQSFVEQALGEGHRVLAQMAWGGSAADIAWELAKTCQALNNNPVAHRPDLSPLCALLAEAREQFGGHGDCAARIADLARRLGCPGEEPEVDWEFAPYPGMEPLDYDQAPIFFGRETETADLLARLDTEQGRRLLLVAGRSGSGKSSLVRAGLWARLHDAARTPLAGSERWVISAMKPAAHGLGDPFFALCLGLLQAQPRVPGLRDADQEARALSAADTGFAALLGRVLDGRDGAEWLLIIDQFEELFTSVTDDRRAAFLDRLLPALALPRLRVVATVRSDFLDHCIAHPGLCAEIRAPGALYPLDIPDASALRRMITGPLRERVLAPAKRASIDDDLVKRLVSDAGGRAGGLALLAFALADLYQERLAAVDAGAPAPVPPRLMLAHYLEPSAGVGDGTGAAQAPVGLDRFIAKRAVAAAGRAGSDTERVLTRVFGRLLTVAADGAPTRLREDLAHWDQDPEALALIAALSAWDTRLLVLDARYDATALGAGAPPGAAHGRVVEVAHEALFQAWPDLAGWIERRKEALIRRPQLRREVARWDAEGRRDQRVPNPYLVGELRTLFEEAGLWRDLIEKDKDGPSVAQFLVRDDPAELLALVRRAQEAQATEPKARAQLLHTLTRNERGSATLSALVAALRAHDGQHGSDLTGWLRAGIDPEALFTGPDAPRWHWHRVAVGDLLDALGDPRDGLGLVDGLPAIAWQPVPAGPFPWQDGSEERHTAAFRIARYPITNAQYRAFTRAEDYEDPRWWPRGLERPYEHDWSADNRPRVAMTWTEALAFCRWLTERLRAKGPAAGGIGAEESIRLPTEVEWEKAARGTERRAYPWGNDYVSGDANIDETFGKDKVGELYLRQTTAVGLYPRNRSPYGLMDCSGNVWEWCLNKADDEDGTDLDGDEARGVRGGSWVDRRAAALVSYRNRDTIDVGSGALGFRVCRVGPIR